MRIKAKVNYFKSMMANILLVIIVGNIDELQMNDS